MQLIGPELANRLRAPCKSVAFYTHLFVGIIGFSAAGVYLSFLRPNWRMEDLSAALLGYFPALFGAAALEFTAEDQPFLRYFGWIALGLLIPLAFIAARTKHIWQLLLSLTGAGIGILFWWLANGLNKKFDDVIKPQNALGGDGNLALAESKDKEWKK